MESTQNISKLALAVLDGLTEATNGDISVSLNILQQVVAGFLVEYSATEANNEEGFVWNKEQAFKDSVQFNHNVVNLLLAYEEAQKKK